MLIKLSALTTPKVVKMTTSCVNSEKSLINMTFPFQWMRSKVHKLTSVSVGYAPSAAAAFKMLMFSSNNFPENTNWICIFWSLVLLGAAYYHYYTYFSLKTLCQKFVIFYNISLMSFVTQWGLNEMGDVWETIVWFPFPWAELIWFYSNFMEVCSCPPGTRHNNNNVIITSRRRHDVVLT